MNYSYHYKRCSFIFNSWTLFFRNYNVIIIKGIDIYLNFKVRLYFSRTLIVKEEDMKDLVNLKSKGKVL